MTTMIRALSGDRRLERQRERAHSNLVRLEPATPPRSYRLQCIVWIADRGWGESPRYAVEFEHVDNMWSGIEWEGDDSIEALRQALHVVHENSDREQGIRIEFASPADLAS
jgi:hypothetical protein